MMLTMRFREVGCYLKAFRGGVVAEKPFHCYNHVESSTINRVSYIEGRGNLVEVAF